MFLDASAAAPGTTATLSLVPGRRGNRGQAGSLSPTPHPALPAHTAELCKQDGWVWKACRAPKLLISTAWWAPHQPASARGCVCHEMGTKKAQLRLKIPSLLLNREISLSMLVRKKDEEKSTDPMGHLGHSKVTPSFFQDVWESSVVQAQHRG